MIPVLRRLILWNYGYAETLRDWRVDISLEIHQLSLPCPLLSTTSSGAMLFWLPAVVDGLLVAQEY